MNIVFVTTEYTSKKQSSGGLATFTRNMAGMFAAHGNNVRVMLVTTKAEEHDTDEGVILENIYIKKDDWEEMDYLTSLYGNKFCFDHNKMRADIVDVMKAYLVRDRLEELNKTQKIDIVHFCNHGALFRFVKDIPYVVRISGIYNIWLGGANTIDGSVDYNHKEDVRDIVEADHLKKSLNVICPSKLMAKLCLNEFGIRCNVLQSPISQENSDKKYDVFNAKLRDKKYILFFGTVSYLKGVGVISKMIYRILEKYRDVYFVMAGRETFISNGGKEQPASSLVIESAKEYSDRVIILGALSRNQLVPVIENAELCVLPSRIENLSNACLEAMALGKIVIGTNGASFEEIIDDGENGFLCEIDNADDFFEKTDHVMSLSEEQKMIIGDKARNKVAKLQPDELYSTYYDYYFSVIENSSR